MISTSQIHWIAGLLEGEGTFNYTTVGTDGKEGQLELLCLQLTKIFFFVLQIS